MVLDFRSLNKLPFIYDTYQLAEFFSLNRKTLFRLVRECDNYYRLITVKKKNGRNRTVYAPLPTLKYAQCRIHRYIASKLPVSQYATAYKAGSRIYSNASPHTNKKYLLKLDITDFFGSIRFEQVYSAAFNTRYFPKQIGVMLTTLCCLKGALPQGAPSSPAVSNLVMRNFDENIGNWCKKHNISYTRYCDDITFSSDFPLYIAFTKAKNMLENMGFELNEKKTRFITNANRQSVTGLTVNEKVAVSKEYKRKLRQELHYIFKYGPVDSVLHTGKTEFITDGKVDTLKYLNTVKGRLNFILSVEKNNTYFKDALKKLP